MRFQVKRKGTPDGLKYREFRGERSPGPGQHQVSVGSLSTSTRAPAASLRTSWQRYALNNPSIAQSHIATEGTVRHPQGEFTANQLTKAFQPVSRWRSSVVASIGKCSRSMTSMATKSGLQALRELYSNDAMQGPGPGVHPPSKAVTLPVLSQHRGCAKFPFGRRTEGPAHLSGPNRGMPGVFERRWGEGGTLGAGAGVTASTMGKQNPRSKASGQWVGMGGRNHTCNAAEWRRSAERTDDLLPAEHSVIGPKSRYGMTAGYNF